MRTPLKARLSLLRQRAILTVRYFFRLPIDEIRDYQLEAALKNLSSLTELISTQNGLLNQVHARLRWYETRVPNLKREHKAFLEYMEKLQMKEPVG